jgi:hypothetical protein
MGKKNQGSGGSTPPPRPKGNPQPPVRVPAAPPQARDRDSRGSVSSPSLATKQAGHAVVGRKKEERGEGKGAAAARIAVGDGAPAGAEPTELTRSRRGETEKSGSVGEMSLGFRSEPRRVWYDPAIRPLSRRISSDGRARAVAAGMGRGPSRAGPTERAAVSFSRTGRPHAKVGRGPHLATGRYSFSLFLFTEHNF